MTDRSRDADASAKMVPRGNTAPTPDRTATSPAVAVPFGTALRFWIKLGFISFGGPAGQIAIMHRELVERRRWIGEERFLHALNYCMLLPGPEATQLAIYIGWLLHRTLGGVVAGVFFVLPSVFLLWLLSYLYAAYGQLPAVAGVLAGVKPVVVAIVVDAVMRIGRRAVKTRAHALVAAAAFAGIYVLQVPFPAIVLAAAMAGWTGSRLAPQWFVAAAPAVAPQHAAARALPAVIDDHGELPAHTRPAPRRVARLLAVGTALWACPFLLIVLWRGWSSLHAQAYRFFTVAAFVTFGGAYAVLAYVTQVATTSYHWLTHAQAVDGLALAETTPGPLIMVLQFVGFIAGWMQPHGMGQLASATLGAVVATWTTFLPCFFFILIGAPYVEIIRGNRAIGGALAGVTASVVGVILNLALVFGLAVIWPRGVGGGTDWGALAISLAAFATLYRLEMDVLWVVLGGAVVGLLGWLAF